MIKINISPCAAPVPCAVGNSQCTPDRHALLGLGATLAGPAGIRVRPTMQIDDDHFPHIYASGDICDHYKVKLAGVGMYGACIATRDIACTILLLLGRDHSLHDEPTARSVSDDDMALARCITALSLLNVPTAASPYDSLPTK
ncbi:hypothetical protein H4R19_003556 [Coemansia spiralis]|nr:hypothetical protein H4R19_003556 [Coemansia spiralis]